MFKIFVITLIFLSSCKQRQSNLSEDIYDKRENDTYLYWLAKDKNRKVICRGKCGDRVDESTGIVSARSLCVAGLTGIDSGGADKSIVKRLESPESKLTPDRDAALYLDTLFGKKASKTYDKVCAKAVNIGIALFIDQTSRRLKVLEENTRVLSKKVHENIPDNHCKYSYQTNNGHPTVITYCREGEKAEPCCHRANSPDHYTRDKPFVTVLKVDRVCKCFIDGKNYEVYNKFRR